MNTGYRFATVTFADSARPLGPVLIAVPHDAPASIETGSRWLPAAPNAPSRTAWCDEAAALRWAGRGAVVAAIARAQQRGARPMPTQAARARAGRALAALYTLQGREPQGGGGETSGIAVAERSARLPPPRGHDGEDGEVWVRMNTPDGYVTARGGLGRGDQPQVVAWGDEHDIALPDWRETARRIAGDDAGLRPRATSIETLLHIARRADATRVLAQTTTAAGAGADTPMTRAELIEGLLATTWPTATPENTRIAWWAPVARAKTSGAGETTARLELERGGKLALDGADLVNAEGDAARMDTLVRALLEAGRKGPVRWTDRNTPRVTAITARPRSAR